MDGAGADYGEGGGVQDGITFPVVGGVVWGGGSRRVREERGEQGGVIYARLNVLTKKSGADSTPLRTLQSEQSVTADGQARAYGTSTNEKEGH